VAVVHGLGAGTDVTTVVMRWVTALSIVATGAALAWRLTRRWPFRTFVRLVSLLALSLLTADAALSGVFGMLSRSALGAGGVG
jgi:hypothetical protein